MGCWDTYCFICGNSCYGLGKYIYTEFKNAINNDDAHDRKYYLDILKKFNNEINFFKDIKTLCKDTKWIKNATMLLVDDTIVHGLRETSCNVSFTKGNEVYTQIGFAYDNIYYGSMEGIFIHTDCWKFIKKNYKVELKFSMLPPIEYNKTKLFDINYGDIEKFQNQYFSFLDVLLAKKAYLCSSPLKSDKNIIQIKKNISYLKLKNQPKRQGPVVSANFYKTGDIKIGKNKNFWVIKGGKWIEIKEKPEKINVKINKITLKQLKWLKRIPFIGQTNTEPIFINYILFNRNIHNIEFILLEDMKSYIIKYI
jgi:hypothetical protein